VTDLEVLETILRSAMADSGPFNKPEIVLVKLLDGLAKANEERRIPAMRLREMNERANRVATNMRLE
jgi:hypothetical protein